MGECLLNDELNVRLTSGVSAGPIIIGNISAYGLSKKAGLHGSRWHSLQKYSATKRIIMSLLQQRPRVVVYCVSSSGLQELQCPTTSSLTCLALGIQLRQFC